MRLHHLRAIASLSAVAMLAGCRGQSVALPSQGLASVEAPHVEANGSWMLPEAKKQTLLYISYEDGVSVFTYPGEKPAGFLTGFTSPEGLCSDRGGNVFVTDIEQQAVFEFAHGGTEPIARLAPYYSGQYNPFDCSVDPTSKTLAVSSADSNYTFFFTDETGTPAVYKNPYAYGFFCTYDGAGNFFARGTQSHVAELPKGSSSFENIKLSGNIKDLTGFAWDGKYLSINSGVPSQVNYRVQVQGTHATIVRKARFGGAEFLFQVTIFNQQLIGADEKAQQVAIWSYPNIGSPVNTIGLQGPIGVAISLAH